MAMPRFRNIHEVCADCNAPDPSWASVNRGVYLCNECAGIHRNLGRHVSQVKHNHKSVWHPNQFNMVHQLVIVGANSIWEHSLLDPAQTRSGKRKPNPNDPVHTIKNEFIHAKYEQLAFVHRPTRRDDEDLGKQLHASVRTANLDTSLRLLSQGAQANFFHPERCNTPLHVAAKAGQALQVELLVTYGADPAGLDGNKQTPEDLARNEGHYELADRLVELQYELTDRLSHFVWGIKPDHKLKNHFAIPKSRDNGVGLDGRKKLQALSNQIFEELAMDVFDEVDRRETEQLWQEMRQAGGKIVPTADHIAVPFLTVNPEYSTTRNQGRQKLARFTPQEFSVLISDILYDIIRRQSLSDGSLNFHLTANSVNLNIKDEEPIYDEPPEGDLDYQLIEKNSTDRPNAQPTVPLSDFRALQQKLNDTEEQVNKLQELNRDLSNKVTALAKKNHELLKQQQQQQQYSSAFKPTTQAPAPPPASAKPAAAPSNSTNQRSGVSNNTTRPCSVYNTNNSFGSHSSLASIDNRRRTIHETPPGSISKDDDDSKSPKTPSDQGADKPFKLNLLREGSPHNSVGSEYDNHTGGSDRRKESCGSIDTPGRHDSSNSNTNNNANVPKNTSPTLLPNGGTGSPESKSPANNLKDSGASKPLPGAQDVFRKTETVTKNIQNLLQAAQKSKTESYLTCSENILAAVQETIDLFPSNPNDPAMLAILTKLGAGAQMLRDRCSNIPEQVLLPSDSKQVTEEIIKNAYEIAKAEKELVTMTNKLQSESGTLSSN